MAVRTWQGDITTLGVDAIVNAANRSLARGSGVCGAIFAAAGPELDEACARVGGCETGDAVATAGFALPARWVIHTVGPIWQGGDAGDDDLLASCYRRVVQVADGLGARSLAIPAISTGVYGFPAQRAARIAVDTVRRVIGEAALDDVVLVAFDAETAQRYAQLLGEPA